jgi:hypothetical protein
MFFVYEALIREDPYNMVNAGFLAPLTTKILLALFYNQLAEEFRTAFHISASTKKI